MMKTSLAIFSLNQRSKVKSKLLMLNQYSQICQINSCRHSLRSIRTHSLSQRETSQTDSKINK